MKKRKPGRRPMKDNKKATVQVPVRISPEEERELKKLTKFYGDIYMTRTIRRLINQACERKEIVGV